MLNPKLNENLEFKYEFHISGEMRKTYKFSSELFTLKGNVVFADFSSVREFAYQYNLNKSEDERVNPGEINALGLLDEIFHHVFRIYENQINAGVYNRLVKFLHSEFGQNELYKLVFNFVEKFPPSEIYNGHLSTLEYLQNYSGSKSNYEISLEEIILLYLDNLNPAGSGLKELFDENLLDNVNVYKNVISKIELFFSNEPPIGNENLDVITFLKSPFAKHPNSLTDQLEYIRSNWGLLLDSAYMNKILMSKDFSKETIILEQFGTGDIPTAVPHFKGVTKESFQFALGKSGYKFVEKSSEDYDEPEKFTPDTDWMPNVVLIAKNIYVWLDQLKNKYNENIFRLDQIPDAEIDQLSAWGINGLWLIGIWERSRASKRIKHILGNIDAVASAYSLYDYQIANDLGGNAAYENFHERCTKRGIRLASDMVPNHTGICSKWVIEHPDYFIQTEKCPFPNYKFTGEDLSGDPNIEIKIEDGYWNHTDAAVVFRRVDKRNSDVRYIYHGNDGTIMPWNDTAQLDMLKEEVRKAVIEKIFEVARKFSIIRFDAAMTLAKKHFSRLWYPEPGKGGDISSRSDFSMTKNEFNNFFPVEFWREVVDKINNELPNTLLLAEAFWMMEGYFVRSLGMHRVYNSAFMHMLMKEENEKYRDLITNTLEFEPEILKRYVNFMSNPDEETAIHQFGTDDKYFGVATLMATLPGLPMLAHGQIEGYREKYGMEYKRAYYDEKPNIGLIERHEKEIFPLLKLRFLFSGVENFWLYDFMEGNSINENVFAFSNMANGKRALVFYNNRYQSTSGTIKESTFKLCGEDKEILKQNLTISLNISSKENIFYIFKDAQSDLEYIKSGFELLKNGFYIELNGFESHVFLDFTEVYDHKGNYTILANKLNGRGTTSIDSALKKIEYQKIHYSIEHLLKSAPVKDLAKIITCKNNEEITNPIRHFCEDYEITLNSIKSHFNLTADTQIIAGKITEFIKISRLVNKIIDSQELPIAIEDALMKNYRLSAFGNYLETILLYLLYQSLKGMQNLFDGENKGIGENLIDKLFLEIPFRNILQRLGRSEDEVYDEISLLNSLILDKRKNEPGIKKAESRVIVEAEYDNDLFSLIEELFSNNYARAYMNVNLHKGIWFFNQERFEDIVSWIFTLNINSIVHSEISDSPNLIHSSCMAANKNIDDHSIDKLLKELIEENSHFKFLVKIIEHRIEALRKIKSIAVQAGFRLDKFILLLQEQKK